MNNIKRAGSILMLLLAVLIFGEAMAGETAELTGITEAHNEVRAALDVRALEWSDELAAVAQEWAVHLASRNRCKMQHRPKQGKYARGYGENIYWAGPLRWSDGRKEIQNVSPDKVVKRWAGEAADYRYSDNSCRQGRVCGHYTQLVWKSSMKVGCGMARCSDKGQIWVCNYDPPGNYIGQKPY